MTEELSPERRRALVRFRDALVDFADDPSPDNVERYLAASQALDATRARGRAVERSANRETPPLAA